MLWADDMHNCVHGYGSYIDNGGMVYGVFKEGKIKYNISVSQYGNLEQFYKACNMTPEPEDYSFIVRHLVNSGAVKSFPVG
ncbi:MAG TPA: hypothetical protein PLP33_14790 [Leptospiraceae bacterium]|nr:hypothetical protein [Leptospiraceae bacterium]